MACDDRQLTQAQRAEGARQQPVLQAVRPFSGNATLENLVDYINRELYPALKAARNKVNDVYERVRENAPSGNPLQFYFSSNTGNADPTTGFIRLNQATQNTATVLRVSQTNGRLQDVAPWLDVMAGGATTPLGTITLSDVINPARFLRFDLNTMVDQGTYWDLGVSIIESSHPNPFVDDGGIVIAFIPGVASTGATVPPSGLSPIATDTFLGNITGSTGAPSAVPLANVDSTSITYDGTAHEFRRAALTGDVTASANSNATTIANDAVTNAKLANMAAARVKGVQVDGSTGDPQDLTGAEVFELVRAGTVQIVSSSLPLNITLAADTTQLCIDTAGDGEVQTISGASNGRIVFVQLRNTGTKTIKHSVSTNGVICPGLVDFRAGIRDSFWLVGDAAGSLWELVGGPPLAIRDGDKGDITVSGSGATWTIDNDVVSDAKLRDSAALSVIGRSANSSGDPADIAAGTDAHVLRRSGATLGFGTVATAGIADDAVTNEKLRNGSALSVIGRSANSSGDPADIAASGGLQFLQTNAGGTVLGFGTLTLAALPTQATDTFLGNISGSTAVPSAVALTSIDSTSIVYDGTAHELQRAALTGDVTASQNSNATTIANDAVTNAKAANMAQATIKGRALGAGTGDPTDLTGAQSGAIQRWTAVESFTLTGGTANTLTLANGTTWVYLSISGAGDAVVDEIAYGGSTAERDGIRIILAKNTGTGGIVLRNNAAKLSNQITPPAAVDFRLDGALSAVMIAHNASSWCLAERALSLANLPAIADDTFLANISGGSAAPSAVALTTLAGAGLTGGADAVLNVGAGTGITVNANDIAVTIPLTDGDKGDITVSSSGATFTIDNSTVTLAKMANLAASRVIGQAVGASTAAPAALTGAQVGALTRWSGTQTIDLTAGATSTLTVNDGVTYVYVTIAGTGDVVIDEIVYGSSSTGARLIIANNDAGAGRVILRNNAAKGAFQIALPASTDYYLLGALDAVEVAHNSFSWVLATSHPTSLAGTGISYAAGKLSVSVPLTDGDKGDITTSSTGTVWTIDNDVVSDAKLRNSAALSVIGRSANSSGDPADIATSSASNAVLRESGGSLSWGSVGTANIATGAITTNLIAAGNVTLTKIVDIGQSRILGRAEGAGTGTTTELTPAQVSAIIDGADFTWTGSHVFAGLALTADVTSADILLGANPGGVGLFAGQATTNVTNGDLVLNASSGIAINAGGTAVTSAANGNIDVTGTNLTATCSSNIVLSATASVTLAGGTSVLCASPFFPSILQADGTVQLQGIISPTISADQNNWNPTGLSSATVIRVTASGANRTITGIAGGAIGRILILINVGTNLVIVDDENTSSSAANRILHNLDAPELQINESFTFWYDTTSSRWRIIGFMGSVNP